MNGKKYICDILLVALILLGSLAGFALVGSFIGTATATATAESSYFPGNDHATSSYDYAAQLSAADSDLDIVIDRKAGIDSSGNIDTESQTDQGEDIESSFEISPDDVINNKKKEVANIENIINRSGQISSIDKTSEISKESKVTREERTSTVVTGNTPAPTATARPTETPKVTETPRATPTSSPTPVPTATKKIDLDFRSDNGSDTITDNDSLIQEDNSSWNTTASVVNGSNDTVVSVSANISVGNDSSLTNKTDIWRSPTENDTEVITESRIREIEDNLSRPVAGGSYELWLRYNDAKILHRYYREKASNKSELKEYSDFFAKYYSDQELFYRNKYVSGNSFSVNVSNNVKTEIVIDGTNTDSSVNVSSNVNVEINGSGANKSFVENKSFSNMSQNFEFGIPGRGASVFAGISIKHNTWQDHPVNFSDRNWSYLNYRGYDWRNWNDSFWSNKSESDRYPIQPTPTSTVTVSDSGTVADDEFEDNGTGSPANESIDQDFADNQTDNIGNETNDTVIINNVGTVGSSSGTFDPSCCKGFYDNWSYEGPWDYYSQRNVSLMEFNGAIYVQWRDGRLSIIGAVNPEAKIKSWGWDVDGIRSVTSEELYSHGFTFPQELGYKPGTVVRIENSYVPDEVADGDSQNSQEEMWLISGNNMKRKLSSENAKSRYSADGTDYDITLTADSLSHYKNGGDI